MDILTVSNMYPSRKDPAYGTFVRNFYESIRSRNPEGKNHLVTIRGRRKNKASKLCTYISFYVRLTWRLLFGRYDLIYIHTITFPILPVRIALWFRSLPLAFNVHGDDLLPKGKLKRWLKHLACKPLLDARLVVSPSSYYKKVLLEEFPLFRWRAGKTRPGREKSCYRIRVAVCSRQRMGYISGGSLSAAQERTPVQGCDGRRWAWYRESRRDDCPAWIGRYCDRTRSRLPGEASGIICVV